MARLNKETSLLTTRPSLRSNSGSSTLPLPSFRLVPGSRLRAHLDALVAGAGCHPPPVEVERNIMDEVLVVRRDAACHKHGFRQDRDFSVCTTRFGEASPSGAPTTAHQDPLVPACKARADYVLRAPPVVPSGPGRPRRVRLRLLNETNGG